MSNLNNSRGHAVNRGQRSRTILLLLGCLVAYALFQPVMNQVLGWKLPGVLQIVELLQSPESTKTRELVKGTVTADEKGKASPANLEETGHGSAVHKKSDAQKSSGADGQQTKSDESIEDYLKKLPKNRFQSPAGLLYGPGSEEGHRLKHVERHLADIPNRPGSHGVFDGSMVDFLKAIDQAYLMSKSREKGTSIKEDEGAMVYEATFAQTIGYLGGQNGARQKHPKLKRMRLVIRNGNEVITAFPIR